MKISLSYPDTGLTIAISVFNRTTAIVAFTGTMTEVDSTRVYKYDFTETANTDYVYVATCTGYNNMSGTIYYTSSSGGLTTEEHNQLFAIGGGGIFKTTGGLTAQDRKYIKETHEKVMTLENTDLSEIDTKLNEIDSHNNLAKDNIINTIKETENYICKDIKKTNTELTKDNVATRQLIRQKSDKIDKNISKLNDRQELTDKMIEDEADELEEEIDKLYEKEADDLEKEIDDQLNQEFDQIETEINHITNGNN